MKVFSLIKKADPGTVKVWRQVKLKYSSAIVLVRVADNYWTFNKDAKAIETVISVKAEQCEPEEWQNKVDYYMIDQVLHKMVRQGFRVALCDVL